MQVAGAKSHHNGVGTNDDVWGLEVVLGYRGWPTSTTAHGVVSERERDDICCQSLQAPPPARVPAPAPPLPLTWNTRAATSSALPLAVSRA